MRPATPVSRRRRIPSRSWTPPAIRISASYDRTSDRTRSRSGVAPPWLRTNRPTPAPTSSLISDSTVGGRSRRHGKAARRSGRGSRPTASQSPATEGVAEPVRDRRRSRWSSRPASRRPRTRSGWHHRSPRRRPPGAGRRRARRSRRWPRPRPVRRPGRRRSRPGGSAERPSPRTSRRSGPGGRSAHPTPAAAPGQ